MLRLAAMILITGSLAVPVAAQQVAPDDFRPRVLADLVALCGVNPEDPLSAEAIHFCHGYVTGAWQYYEASMAGPDAQPFVCPPTPPPSRDQAVEMFLIWGRQHPERSDDAPINGLFRFLAETWPCQP
ncbi:MAG TPA: Rap1a/Tai family immunity protein [Alphaproteobacteria bacterium]|nr:Rap1a/Tai family immunity protein [Alphaproteobacteria bacterium]